ncbi:MAG: S8 family peptidase [Flavobacteriales bacterium]
MNRLTGILLAIILMGGCSKKNYEQEFAVNKQVLQVKASQIAVPEGEVLSKEMLDDYVLTMLEREHDFRWEWADMKTLWSAVVHSDNSVAIGYKPTGVGDIETIMHQIDLQNGAWKATHDALLKFVLDELNVDSKAAITERDVVIEDDKVLPIIIFRMTSKDMLTKLHNLENVRYIEPLDYWPGTEAERSTSGCSGSTYALNTADYTTSTPNCLLPWNHAIHNIASAWNSKAGEGITVGIIDAGISASQSLLNADFNNGDSNIGRTITTEYTFGNSAFTSCTHGTSMSGLAVGPRNNTGATSGVAYKSSLHFIRGCEDVVLDKSSEKTGVKNALVKMGQKPDVKIVSMSIGSPFYSSVIYDGVVYAHNQGKMLFAAAGTSFSFLTWWGVTYPAVHAQCVAVTGVKENNNTCDSCHDGSEVDFTIVMERNSNASRNTLSLKQSGNTPSYIGGSSAATATAAGIAAVVWSVNTGFTREQVYDYLLTTSQFYPNPNGATGYGNLNAGAAVAAAQAAM